MELIIFIIIIAVVISNAKTGNNENTRNNSHNRSNKKSASVWDQVDKGGSEFLKSFVGEVKKDQINRGIRDLEDAINNVKRKTIQKAKRKEEISYQQEQAEWRRKQEEERKRREFEERQKKKLELQKKEAEQRRRMLEKEKREREEQALLEHCQVAQDKGCSVHNDYRNETTGTESTLSSERKDNNLIKGHDDITEGAGYRIEEYLDPLTSSFYPKVEEYLSPTIASFYPDVDVTSFSLQNSKDML